MHYPDLTLCHYHNGPFDAGSWSVPLLTTGWLEHPHEFRSGMVSDDFTARLRDFVSLSSSTYSQFKFRGVHICSHCEANKSLSQPGPIWSQEIIIVPGDQVIYAAPGGIVHYVEEHAYVPPQDFIEAVMRCPNYGSPAFQQALRLSNAGNLPPMVTAEEDHKRWRQSIASSKLTEDCKTD